ncbi:hypothetical protein BD324DRAFT_410162 [Kockovaella imperatae]|uniref:Uncharacterized protein n=1 Tax=Kockovaella imperatae TaxID=4999 RepID=A0A1Y1ULF6_9TREE|nr:hypothetical protein BD324DRAFT_410162 [Kockovaella imperatae]ORX37955.1 hypothetical protein BD324DRAFT_410162 [Kockovaella imperatae]
MSSSSGEVSVSPTAKLPLQEWLKLLSSRGVDMRVAMALAAKIYNSHNTRERLSQLTAQKLANLLPDKEGRKSVLNAVKGIADNQPMKKKRGRDSDLLEPLQSEEDRAKLPKTLEFHEIIDPEKLIPVSITVNRAPLKTAWAYTVALRLGFDIEEALSIAHVYVHLSSLRHALMLGNILNKQETKEAEEELAELPGGDDQKWSLKRKKVHDTNSRDWRNKGKEKSVSEIVGSSQPWVQILRAKIPVIERPDGTWRAIQKGVPVPPSTAYLYITRAFKDYCPHIMGSLKLLADSWTPDELNRLGMHMYNQFKPDTVEWGQRAILECAKILDQMKGPVTADDEDGPEVPEDLAAAEQLSPASGAAEEVDPEFPVAKRPRMTVEEYEAMLDAENLGGGFVEGGDIAGAERQDA